MTLDIIIPHYKEPWELCKYLFDTIATQRGVLFDQIKVILVNDGDDCVLDAHNWADYPFAVDYIIKPHGGVSSTRNAGLRESKADYVMFCDADDGFLNNYALNLVFSAAQEEVDYLICNFIEETFDASGNPAVVRHDNDLTFMHGKVYRRQFLIDHDLFFDESMNIHEDGYFNLLVFTTATHEGKSKQVGTPIYIWRWNNDSVVRKDRKDFVLKTYKDVILTRTGVCRQLKQRGYDEDYVTAVAMTVCNSFYDFNKPAFINKKNAELTKAAEKEFKRFWNEFQVVFNNCTNEKIADIATAARDTARKNGLLFEQTDLKSWLRHIERDVK